MTISSCLLGIDLGTSSTKTVIIDSDGRLLSQASQPYPIESPKPGWAEQDPETWFQAALDTVQQAVMQAGIRPGVVTAIGLSGQMHSTVCLDAQGNPLRPAIIWADQRSSTQVEYVAQQIGTEQLGHWTANPLATGFMLATWLWLRENEPQTFERCAHMLLPKDYVRYRLTGEIGTEPSDASSTLLFDTIHQTWSQELLTALSLPLECLPRIQPSIAIAGKLLPEIAAAMNLSPGTPVVYGASDQACQAVGNGIIQTGMVSSTIGTGGQLLAPLSEPRYDPELRLHLFCHALPDTWHLEAAILSAGFALQWLRDQILPGSSYQELADLALSAPPGSEGLFFLPHLAGERTPHMNPNATASFTGLTLRHNCAHLVRAVMEGVVLAMKAGFDLMVELGVIIEKVVASGGAIQHPLWLQLQADIFNRPLYRTQTHEAAAVGAALLAGVGVGLYKDLPAACHKVVHWEDEIIQPDLEKVDIYAINFHTFTKLYPALTGISG
jgi:xylulokinase